MTLETFNDLFKIACRWCRAIIKYAGSITENDITEIVLVVMGVWERKYMPGEGVEEHAAHDTVYNLLNGEIHRKFKKDIVNPDA